MPEFDFNIPEDYNPLDEIHLCNNIIKKSRYIFNDNGFIPLLIGKGDNETPRIWLFAKDSKYGAFPVIEDNVSNVKLVKLDHYRKAERVKISLISKNKEFTILNLFYRDVPKVTSIDLRPFGYDIQGTANYLSVGGTELKENYFENIESVIAFDNQDSNEIIEENAL